MSSENETQTEASEVPCQRCDGCGQLANSDEREPWSVWLALPLQSAVAVTMGLVKPEPCDECGGSGWVATPSASAGIATATAEAPTTTDLPPTPQALSKRLPDEGEQITQPAGEHDTGTGYPADLKPYEVAEIAAANMSSVAGIYYVPQTSDDPIYDRLAQAAIDAVTPIIRQQVAEEIAAKLEARRSEITPGRPGWGYLTEAIEMAREIGGQA